MTALHTHTHMHSQSECCMRCGSFILPLYTLCAMLDAPLPHFILSGANVVHDVLLLTLFFFGAVQHPTFSSVSISFFNFSLSFLWSLCPCGWTEHEKPNVMCKSIIIFFPYIFVFDFHNNKKMS